MVDFLEINKTFQNAMMNPLFQAGIGLLDDKPFNQAMTEGIQTAGGLQQIASQREQQTIQQQRAQQQEEDRQRALQEQEAQRQFQAKFAGLVLRPMGLESLGEGGDLTPGQALQTMQALTPKAQEQSGIFEGKGMDAQYSNILLSGDPNSPQYALAYNQMTQPKVQMITNPDGSVSQVLIKPKLPGNIRKPLHIKMENVNEIPTAEGDIARKSENEGIEIVNLKTGRPKFNDLQSKSASFATRMKFSNDGLNDLIASGYDPAGVEGFKDSVTAKGWTRFLASPEGQNFQQMRDDFINAQLRRESGAAIGPSEYETADRQYFPMPGDSPSVLKRKKKARDIAFQNMINESSGAYEYYQKQNKKAEKSQLQQPAIAKQPTPDDPLGIL